jgi:hypothetical protein
MPPNTRSDLHAATTLESQTLARALSTSSNKPERLGDDTDAHSKTC